MSRADYTAALTILTAFHRISPHLIHRTLRVCIYHTCWCYIPCVPNTTTPLTPSPRVAILQNLERLREFLGQDVVHRRDVLPELGVHATVRGAHVQQALGGPEADLLPNGLVLLGAHL